MEESVATTLKIASDWKAKGDVRWELSCVGQVLEGLLTIAVTHHDSFEAGVAYLHGKHAEELLARYHALNTSLLDAFLADPEGGARRRRPQGRVRAPRMVAGAVRARRRHPPDRVRHGEREGLAAHEVLDRVPPGDGLPRVTRGVRSAAAAQASGLREALGALSPRRRGPHVGRRPAPALAACADSFTRRNRDKRLNSFPFDGDGRDPVRWEFRLPSILARWNAGS